MLERGFKFRREPLLFMITNSGSDRNSVAWEEHEHAVKVAAGNYDAVTDPTFLGEIIDDTTFSYVCALDEGDDPLTDPTCWVKANPLLGVTITEEYLRETVAQARSIPGQLNGILRLHFCVWTDAETAWMTRETLEPCLAEFDIADHHGRPVYLGLDLSQNRDVTALGAVVHTGQIELEVEVDGKPVLVSKPTFDGWIEAWTPGDTMLARELTDKLPYSVWAAGGHIHAPPGQSISYRHVAQTVGSRHRISKSARTALSQPRPPCRRTPSRRHRNEHQEAARAALPRRADRFGSTVGEGDPHVHAARVATDGGGRLERHHDPRRDRL